MVARAAERARDGAVAGDGSAGGDAGATAGPAGVQARTSVDVRVATKTRTAYLPRKAATVRTLCARTDGRPAVASRDAQWVSGGGQTCLQLSMQTPLPVDAEIVVIWSWRQSEQSVQSAPPGT